MPSPTLPRSRDSRVSVVLADDGANVEHVGLAATLEINTAERDLEAGLFISTPIESDDSGEDNGHPTRHSRLI